MYMYSQDYLNPIVSTILTNIRAAFQCYVLGAATADGGECGGGGVSTRSVQGGTPLVVYETKRLTYSKLKFLNILTIEFILILFTS